MAMNFTKALQALYSGEKVICEDWDAGIPLYMKDRVIYYDNEDGEGVVPYITLNKAIESTWNLYEEPLLTFPEKKYLETVLSPFKDRVVCIERDYSSWVEKCYILVTLDDEKDRLRLPYFEVGAMYNGMKLAKHYTPQDLGLFQ